MTHVVSPFSCHASNHGEPDELRLDHDVLATVAVEVDGLDGELGRIELWQRPERGGEARRAISLLIKPVFALAGQGPDDLLGSLRRLVGGQRKARGCERVLWIGGYGFRGGDADGCRGPLSQPGSPTCRAAQPGVASGSGVDGA